ncbi:hypothetical protein LTR22_021462 [Elasticomyces elasticus]|nr:hypothetical protein LTR22_021462 [Elasticomyces elasticus]KAK4909069.1 hypothetical protein LTR49_022109 [Elasticomyces elasticus]KAK5748466.1 hypothetical protein LTS12_021485 [Elasticomyces elasticus]
MAATGWSAENITDARELEICNQFRVALGKPVLAPTVERQPKYLVNASMPYHAPDIMTGSNDHEYTSPQMPAVVNRSPAAAYDDQYHYSQSQINHRAPLYTQSRSEQQMAGAERPPQNSSHVTEHLDPHHHTFTAMSPFARDEVPDMDASNHHALQYGSAQDQEIPHPSVFDFGGYDFGCDNWNDMPVDNSDTYQFGGPQAPLQSAPSPLNAHVGQQQSQYGEAAHFGTNGSDFDMNEQQWGGPLAAPPSATQSTPDYYQGLPFMHDPSQPITRQTGLTQQQMHAPTTASMTGAGPSMPTSPQYPGPTPAMQPRVRRAPQPRVKCTCASCGCQKKYPARRRMDNVQCPDCLRGRHDSSQRSSQPSFQPTGYTGLSSLLPFHRTGFVSSGPFSSPAAGSVNAMQTGGFGLPDMPLHDHAVEGLAANGMNMNDGEVQTDNSSGYVDEFADEAAVDAFHQEQVDRGHVNLDVLMDDHDTVTDEQRRQMCAALYAAALRKPTTDPMTVADRATAAFIKDQDEAYEKCKKFVETEFGRKHVSAACSKMFWTVKRLHTDGVPGNAFKPYGKKPKLVLDKTSKFTARFQQIMDVVGVSKRCGLDVLLGERLDDLACAPWECVRRKLYNVAGNKGKRDDQIRGGAARKAMESEGDVLEAVKTALQEKLFAGADGDKVELSIKAKGKRKRKATSEDFEESTAIGLKRKATSDDGEEPTILGFKPRGKKGTWRNEDTDD